MVLLVLISGPVVPLAPVAAATLHVDVDASGAADGSSWVDAYTDLQHALAAAAAGDQIWVAEGIYQPVTPAGSSATEEERNTAFELVDGVDVYGGFAGEETALDQRDWLLHPTVLSGNIDQLVTPNMGSYTVVLAEGIQSPVRLDGLVIEHGYAMLIGGDGTREFEGGGIFASDSRLVLSNLVIRDSWARRGAGLAARTGSEVEVSNVEFRDNVSWISGGGVLVVDSNATIRHSLFVDNWARQEDGGGLLAAGTVAIEDVRFVDNLAGMGDFFGNGGALSLSGNAVVRDVEFDGNRAFGGGGAVHVTADVTDVRIWNARFRANDADRGGAMRISGDMLLANASFFDNRAGIEGWFDQGGAIDIEAGSPRIWNASFAGNDAAIGGALHISSLESPQFGNIVAWGNGVNPIFNDVVNGANASLRWSVVQGGCPLGAGCFQVFPVDPLFENAAAGDLRPSAFSPLVDAGDPATDPALFPVGEQDDPVDLAGESRFVNGRIDIGAYEWHEPASLQPSADGVLHVMKGGEGNGSSWAQPVGELRDALDWVNNEWKGDGVLQVWITGGVYRPTASSDDRSASFDIGSRIEIHGGFSGTESTLGERDPLGPPTVLSGDIGGDDIVDADGVTLSWDDIRGGNSITVVTLFGNDANTTLDRVIVTGGHADDAAAGAHGTRGGGLFVAGSQARLIDVAVRGSRASESGGGVFVLGGSPEFLRLEVGGNRALDGGGAYVENSVPTFRSAHFSTNRATGSGGAMSLAGGDSILTDVHFNSNRSTLGGGAIASEMGSPVISNASFVGNLAGTFGGGFLADGLGTSVVLVNARFAGNEADNGGALAAINGSVNTAINATVHANTAELAGGGLFASGEDTEVLLVNTIIWGNGDSAAITAIEPIADFSHTLVEGGCPAAAACSGTLLTADPLFVDAAAGNLRLLPESPAVDAGDPDTDLSLFPSDDVALDIDRQPRVVGDAIDLGAHEHRPWALLVSPGQLLFGDLAPQGTPEVQLVEIVNAYHDDVTLGTAALAGEGAARFSIEDDGCSAVVLAPTATCTLAVRFDASGGGVSSATLHIDSDDPYSPYQVQLTGGEAAIFGDGFEAVP